MQNDSTSYDSLADRPLPKWLLDQKTGMTTVQPVKSEPAKDHSLQISLLTTGIFILLAVAFLTVYFLRKHKKTTI